MQPVKHTILCVDDEPVNVNLLKAVLIPRGYNVVDAIDGKEALEKLKKQKVDVVLLDVMMPILDGYEVCRRIKSDDKLKNIPVVMITALYSKEDRVKGIEAGAEDFISKPFDRDEVLAHVRNLIKVKELNDSLTDAYANIYSLTSFGSQIMRGFNSAEFSLMSMLDNVMEKILRFTSDSEDKPQKVLLRLLNERKTYDWYQYEVIFGKPERVPFKPDIKLKNMDQVDYRTLYCNQAAVENKFGQLADKLKAHNIIIENMVCYLSDVICVFALNYNSEVNKYDATVLEALVTQTLFLRALALQISETENAFAYTVHALARASEANDEDTGNHILRVGEYCALLADRIGMSSTFVKQIKLYSVLHDVGKINTPPDVLRKKGALTPMEWTIMKQHTIDGGRIIGDNVHFKMAKTIALTHHEKWDGSGYPHGLVAENIPIEGRIVAIADCYDALRSPRPYKLAFDHQTVCKIMLEGDNRLKPSHFDPNLLKTFRDCASEFNNIYERLKDNAKELQEKLS